MFESVVVFLFCFVFFFKQKTAYEIVDCDWSSDVCSSDLKWQSRNGILEWSAGVKSGSGVQECS